MVEPQQGTVARTQVLIDGYSTYFWAAMLLQNPMIKQPICKCKFKLRFPFLTSPDLEV